MKYIIWICVFFAYMLMFVGIFKLTANLSAGIMVEVDVEREVYGETVVSTLTMPFNDVSARLFGGGYGSVRWIISTLTLLITLGGAYAAAHALSSYWVSDDGHTFTKSERAVWLLVYAILFFGFKQLFKIDGIDDLLSLNGALFMAATCGGSYAASVFLCRLLLDKRPAAGGKEAKTA